ncbi:MAG: hypothetical protein LBB36_02015 [Fibromonadaceae bacterium]|jgi:C-terminal processing protease CtpA/Prc|nr:hypothetical protein [Fibromonadaceae bacterium]
MPLIILLFPLLFLACGELGQSSEEDKELHYNYLLLNAYFYHPERIKPYTKYQGMEVDSMYSSLKDYFKGNRYTIYYPPDTSKQVLDDIENTPKYYSFGFVRYLYDDTLHVDAVYPISPAAGAGLEKRDKLLFANDIPLTGSTAGYYEYTDTLFAASTVFTVLRGEEILILPVMQKEEVPVPTVYLDSLYGIPLISITEFTRNTNDPNGTYAEFKKALQSIKGAKAAIIDVRYNPGGSIYHCTAMAAELAPSLNSELVYDVEHNYDSKKGNVIDTVHYFARRYLSSIGDGADIKWIIIQNKWSASCAERFTAAVKSSRPETVIIGQASYGKGVGQVYTVTPHLGGLAKITSIQTYYPNGKTFHEIGVVPDVPTEEGDINALRSAAIEAAQKFDPGVLAKRSPTLLQLEIPLPEHSPRKTDLGAYKVVDLLHQWE